MTKTTKTTINYAAKEAYKLFVMRGLTKSQTAGLDCQYFYSETLKTAFILVNANGKLNPVQVKKTWISN